MSAVELQSSSDRAIPRPRSEPSERIARIRAGVLSEPCSLCLERPALLDRFRRSRAGRRARREHPLVSRALALAYLLRHRRPRIYADELIIGNMTSKRIAGNYYTEGGSVNILEDILRLDRRRVPLRLGTAEKARLLWLGLRGVPHSVGARALLKPRRLSHFLDFFRARRYFVTEEAGISHQVVDYRSVVAQGLRHADEQARECLASGRLADGAPLGADEQAFFRSVRIVVQGIQELAANLARAAREQARDPALAAERRQELLALATACGRVPYEPARSFHEGLQACWLVHLALNLEDFEQGLSFGRLDQILLPLYRADVEADRLTPERATELLASFCLKTCETIPLYSERIDRYFSGLGVAQGITLGGTDAEGRDATNELSGLFLDAYSQLRTREPALHARVHSRSPHDFLEHCAEVVQLGCGKPSFFGDPAVVPALEQAGITTADARDYAVIGCVELASQGRTYNSSDAALFNIPLCLELALNQGRALGPVPGWRHRIRRRVGAATPPADRMTSFEDVVDAFAAQVRDSVAEMAQVIGWLEEVYRELRPTPINSMLTRGCLERGRDVTWGGARYDLTSIQGVGLADAADSLLAIRELVFEQQRMSLAALVRILKIDFRGHEKLQAELARRASRYGNGDPAADRMAQRVADVFSDSVRAHRNTRGGQYVPGFYSMTCHVEFGRRTGALPSGRPAGRRLANGLSPCDGADRSGPTAVLRSAAGLQSRDWSNGYALNLKFDRQAVRGRAGRQALASLVRTFVEQGGMQVQINVLDADTLRAAKQAPDEHRGIVVRVAGYCAYFNDLQPDVQDEIIERTAHGSG